MKTFGHHTIVLTVLWGVGLYVLYTVSKIALYSVATLLGIEFGVGIGEWPVRAILLETAIDTAFFVAALASGKYLLIRLESVDRDKAGMRSIMAMLLLALGLAVLRRVFHFLFVGLALVLVSQSEYDEEAGAVMDAVVVVIDLALMIAGVALGRYVLARGSNQASMLRE